MLAAIAWMCCHNLVQKINFWYLALNPICVARAVSKNSQKMWKIGFEAKIDE
jgi:hypothetical protein